MGSTPSFRQTKSHGGPRAVAEHPLWSRCRSSREPGCRGPVVALISSGVANRMRGATYTAAAAVAYSSAVAYRSAVEASLLLARGRGNRLKQERTDSRASNSSQTEGLVGTLRCRFEVVLSAVSGVWSCGVV